MGILNSIIEKVRLWRLTRDEYESLPLRRLFAARWDIHVGLYSYGCFDRWRIPPHTRIGRYCSIAKTARILDANHPLEALTTHPFLYERRFGVVPADTIDPPGIEISDDVWMSHNVTISPGCKRIGRGAVIGAGAVVTRDVPAYAIMAGAPAKLLRYRFDTATQERLEASRWWEMDKPALAEFVRAHPDIAAGPTAANLARLQEAAES